MNTRGLWVLGEASYSWQDGRGTASAACRLLLTRESRAPDKVYGLAWGRGGIIPGKAGHIVALQHTTPVSLWHNDHAADRNFHHQSMLNKSN